MRPILSALALVAFVVAAHGRPSRAQRGVIQLQGELQRDLAFARALAREPDSFDLVERVLARLDRSGLSAKLRTELALATAEIYFEGARHSTARRGELLTRAMDAFRDYGALETAPVHKSAAEAGLAGVWCFYAHHLARVFENAAGEDRLRLRSELINVLSATVAKTADLAAGLAGKDPAARSEVDQQRLFELTFSRGDMLLELAKVESDGSASFQKATQTFAKLVQDAGEGTPWSLRALIGLGDVLAAQGEHRDAVDYYQRAVDFAIPRDTDAWNELTQVISPEERLARFLFVELATPGLMRALVAGDRGPEAVTSGLHFYNTSARTKLALDDPDGQLALLEFARTLAGAGGFIEVAAGECAWYPTPAELEAARAAPERVRTALEFALALTSQVNEFGQGGELAVRARQCIAEIVARPGVQVAPSVLLEAAKSDFDAGDFAATVPAMERVAAALLDADPSERRRLMPEVSWHIGRSFQQLQRWLEAALAFESALETWRGDADFDQRNAHGLLDACEQLQRGGEPDARVAALVANTQRLVAEIGGPVGAASLYAQAEDLYAREQWDAAKRLFERVDAQSVSYEKARVLAGVCALRLGGRDTARAVFDDYLDNYVDLREHQVVGTRELAVRSEARALATFYAGELAFERAEAGQGDWRRVVQLLDGFHLRFETQVSFAPTALYRVLVAHARLGELEPMRTVLATLEREFGSSDVTANAALAAHDALRVVWEAADAPTRRASLAREMALDMRLVNRTTRPPNFDALRREAQLWLELEDWPAAQSVLQHTAELFISGPDAERVTSFVLPDLARALIAQHELQAAADVLKPLVDRKAATYAAARIYARALAGWVEAVPGDAGGQAAFVHVPGLGGDANLEAALSVLESIADSLGDKQTADGFAIQFELIAARREHGRSDTGQLETAKRMLAALKTGLGPAFEHEHMPEELRRKFLWLARGLE